MEYEKGLKKAITTVIMAQDSVFNLGCRPLTESQRKVVKDVWQNLFLLQGKLRALTKEEYNQGNRQCGIFDFLEGIN